MAFQLLSAGGSVQDIYKLQDGHEGFYTGYMGDCTSAIVLWDFDAQRKIYGQVRGIHCFGGIWKLLYSEETSSAFFEDVPNHVSTLLFLLGGGITVMSDEQQSMLARLPGGAILPVGQKEETDRARQLAEANLRAATVRLQHASQAWVRQTGELLLKQPGAAPPINVPVSPKSKAKACVIL